MLTLRVYYLRFFYVNLRFWMKSKSMASRFITCLMLNQTRMKILKSRQDCWRYEYAVSFQSAQMALKQNTMWPLMRPWVSYCSSVPRLPYLEDSGYNDIFFPSKLFWQLQIKNIVYFLPIYAVLRGIRGLFLSCLAHCW